jgi:hypothetical protein
VRLALALLLLTGCYRVTRGDGWAPHAQLQVFGPGPATNLGSDAANTNAIAHVGMALAIPLLGEHFFGRRGFWAAGLSWLGYSLLEEAFWHCPGGCPLSPGYNAEVRTDLLSRVLPAAVLLAWDLATH